MMTLEADPSESSRNYSFSLLERPSWWFLRMRRTTRNTSSRIFHRAWSFYQRILLDARMCTASEGTASRPPCRCTAVTACNETHRVTQSNNCILNVVQWNEFYFTSIYTTRTRRMELTSITRLIAGEFVLDLNTTRNDDTRSRSIRIIVPILLLKLNS